MDETKKGFWEQLRDFARRIKLDSVTVGPARLKFDPAATPEPFSELAHRIHESNAGKTHDVFVLTAHNIDEVTRVHRIDADHECEALAAPLRVPGGSGANTAYALGRLGAAVRVGGIVGDDEDGRMLTESLAESHVDIDPIMTDSELHTGKTITLVEEGGERFIVVFPGANNLFAARSDLDELEQHASSSRIVHLSSFVGSSELQLQEKLVQRIGSRTILSLTPGSLYAKRGLDRLKDMLQHVDVLFLYREQLVKMLDNSSAKSLPSESTTQQLLEALFAWRQKSKFSNPQTVVVKDPLQNSVGQIDQRFLSVATGTDAIDRYFGPMELPSGVRLQAVDTTGSGDAAAAGFLYGIIQKASLDACIDAAFLMASFASTQVGARTAFSFGGASDGRPAWEHPNFLPPGQVPRLPESK